MFISINLCGQIKAEEDWPKSIKRDFNQIKKYNIESVLVYYSYYGPWSTLPDSCNEIPSVWILWLKDGKSKAEELYCYKKIEKRINNISSQPFEYFLSHVPDFDQKRIYIKKHRFLPPIPTDGSWEYLIYMTPKTRYYLSLSEHQRNDTIWKKFSWVDATIKAIDTTRYELKNAIGSPADSH